MKVGGRVVLAIEVGVGIKSRENFGKSSSK